MKKMFEVLFPFKSPAWNSGKSLGAVVEEGAGAVRDSAVLTPSPRHILHFLDPELHPHGCPCGPRPLVSEHDDSVRYRGSPG